MIKKLNNLEERFIEVFLKSKKEEREAATEAVKVVFPNIKNISPKVTRLLQNPLVYAEIQRRLEIMKFRVDYTEEDVITGLWREATSHERGSTQTGRINALVWLGKHIAMFREKDAVIPEGITYNIVNYKTDAPILENITDNVVDIKKIEKTVDLEYATATEKVETTSLNDEESIKEVNNVEIIKY